MADIIKQGHWSNATTFLMFYKKNIVDQSSEFQGGILNKELWREEVRVMNSNC